MAPLNSPMRVTDYLQQVRLARQRRRNVTLAVLGVFCLVVANLALVVYLTGPCP